MAEHYSTQLKTRVNELFEKFIEPALDELINDYDGLQGMKAIKVSESPVMMGIEKYSSILFSYPNGVEHLVCVYWIGGEEKIIVENLRMVTLNRSLSIYNLNTGEIKRTVKLLAGLGKT